LRKDQRPDRERARTIKARQRAIGRELRRIYDDVAQEPVPDDFLDLLRKIDKQEPEGGLS
jgi:Anti-sigma factor NepR